MTPKGRVKDNWWRAPKLLTSYRKRELKKKVKLEEYLNFRNLSQ